MSLNMCWESSVSVSLKEKRKKKVLLRNGFTSCFSNFEVRFVYMVWTKLSPWSKIPETCFVLAELMMMWCKILWQLDNICRSSKKKKKKKKTISVSTELRISQGIWSYCNSVSKFALAVVLRCLSDVHQNDSAGCWDCRLSLCQIS